MKASPVSVLAILHPDRVRALGRRGSWTENKRWTTAGRLLAEARYHGEVMHVLIGDAAHDTTRLLATAVVDRIEIRDSSSVVHVRDVVRCRRSRDGLLLWNTGEPIARDFIRSYALVHTPLFLAGADVFVRERHEVSRRGTTVFTFGYWGSGSNTRGLVRAIDHVERSRGFRPPLWVDIRLHRSVRAEGFHGAAFEELLGAKRYRHVPDLGNLSVRDSGHRVRIRNPKAVKELFQLAMRDRKRRVIFFCGCDLRKTECHRFTVRRLLLREAKRAGVDLKVLEWPGGEPWQITFDGEASQFHTTEWELPRDLSGVDAVRIPWGSEAILRTSRGANRFLIGPARFQKKRTVLPVVQDLDAHRVAKLLR